MKDKKIVKCFLEGYCLTEISKLCGCNARKNFKYIKNTIIKYLDIIENEISIMSQTEIYIKPDCHNYLIQNVKVDKDISLIRSFLENKCNTDTKIPVELIGAYSYKIELNNPKLGKLTLTRNELRKLFNKIMERLNEAKGK